MQDEPTHMKRTPVPPRVSGVRAIGGRRAASALVAPEEPLPEPGDASIGFFALAAAGLVLIAAVLVLIAVLG